MVREATMTDKEFWAIVKKIGWGVLGTGIKPFDYNVRQRDLIASSNSEEMKAFEQVMADKFKALENAIDLQQTKDLPYGGDDSFNDMVNHAIGLGEEYFNKALKDPSVMRKLRVVESFSYCIPRASDFPKSKDARISRAKKVLALSSNESDEVALLEYIRDLEHKLSQAQYGLEQMKKKLNGLVNDPDWTRGSR